MYNITKTIDRCSRNARNTFLFPSNDQKRMISTREESCFRKKSTYAISVSKTRTHRKNRSKVGNGSLIWTFSERRKREEITVEEEKGKRRHWPAYMTSDWKRNLH